MAVDMFIEFPGSEPSIQGETVDKQYADKKAIDIMAWSWGMSNSSTITAGGGTTGGKANFQDMSFTHYFDNATPVLMTASASGSTIAKAILHVRKATGTASQQKDYITVTMEECLITSVSTGGSGGEDRLTENSSFTFGKIKVEYFIQDGKGSLTAGNQFSYSIAENTIE